MLASFAKYTLVPFMCGPDILRAASVSKDMNRMFGRAIREATVFPTSDPGFLMHCIPLDTRRTIAQIQRLFPRNDGYCVSAYVRRVLLAGIDPFTAFEHEVQRAVRLLSAQSRPHAQRNIALVGAWLTGGRCGNLQPRVLRNTHRIRFHLFHSAYCPDSVLLSKHIVNPGQLAPVSSVRPISLHDFLALDPIRCQTYNWKVAPYGNDRTTMLAMLAGIIVVSYFVLLYCTFVLVRSLFRIVSNKLSI